MSAVLVLKFVHFWPSFFHYYYKCRSYLTFSVEVYRGVKHLLSYQTGNVLALITDREIHRNHDNL